MEKDKNKLSVLEAVDERFGDVLSTNALPRKISRHWWMAGLPAKKEMKS
jgi:hypothetical protein